MKQNKPSQETVLLRALRKAGKYGIYNHKIHDLRILSHTKIISNLRAEGYKIVKERVYDYEGKATGTIKYILVEE